MSLRTDLNKIKEFFTPKGGTEKNMAYADNPDSVFDDLSRYTRLIMFVMLIPSSYIGMQYHISLFEKNGMGEMGANVGSLLLFIAIEIGCCFFAPKVFRAIFSGVAFSSLKSLIGIVISIGFIVFFYWFKFGISTNAFSEQHANNKKTELSENSRKNITKKSSYDSQIDDAQKTINKAKKQTWDGKLTKRGEYLLGEGNKTMQRLLSLKDKELSEVSKRDSIFDADTRNVIETSQRSANKYGGIIELTMLLCSLLLPIFEMTSEDAYKKKKNRDDNNEGSNDTKRGNDSNIGFQNVENQAKPYIPFSINKNITNIENRKPIGFDYGKSIEVLPIEKKTNVGNDYAKYLEKIINSHKILFENEEQTELKAYYDKIIKSHQILLNNYEQ
jgi:hypothetical protein